MKLTISEEVLDEMIAGLYKCYSDAFLDGQITLARLYYKELVSLSQQIREMPGYEEYDVFRSK